MITVRKLKLTIVEEDEKLRKEKYDFIANEQYEQYRALNLGMTLLQTHSVLSSYNSGAEAKINSQIKSLEGKIIKSEKSLETAKKEEKVNKLKEDIYTYKKQIDKLIDDFKKNEANRSDIDERFKDLYINDIYTVLQSQVNLKHKDNMSLISQRVKDDFVTARNNGLARGDRSLTTYKRTFPLMTRGRDLYFYEDSGDYYIKWIEGIKFKILVGRNDKNYDELIYTLQQIINYQGIENKVIEGYDKEEKPIKKDNPLKDYRICDSSIQKSDGKIILNLTIDINTVKNKNDFIPGRVIGVDLDMVT